MPITFSPAGGDVLLCDFGPDPNHHDTYPLAAGPCSVSPEMVKRRQVLVLSSHHRMVSVVPFSTVAPAPARNFHHMIAAGCYPFFTAGVDNWIKGDMVTAVSRDRLDRLWFNGQFQRASLSAADYAAGRRCVLHGLALGALVPHL